MSSCRVQSSSSSSSRFLKSQKLHPGRGFKQYSWPSSYVPKRDQSSLHGKWIYDISSVYAFRSIQEIDAQSLYCRHVHNIHIVLQASLVGSGGYLETDVIYTGHSLSSTDKETLIDREAINHCLRPLYLRSAIPANEMFQPEIDASQCRILGRRTVGLPGSNGQTSLSLQGIQPQDNRWIIPFSSQLAAGNRFYIINRFFCPTDDKSTLQLALMAAMYSESSSGALEIPPGNNYYSHLMSKQSNDTTYSDSGDEVSPIEIDDSESDTNTTTVSE